MYRINEMKVTLLRRLQFVPSVTSVLALFPHSAVEYLQDVSGVGGLKHLNITCTFASSIDITLQCSVDLAGPTTKSVMVIKETSSTTAVVMVSFKCGV